MSKKLMAALSTLALVVSVATVSFAADCAGVVTAVDGTKVTVKCADGKDVTAEGAAKVGDKVNVVGGKIAAAKKKGAIEGC